VKTLDNRSPGNKPSGGVPQLRHLWRVPLYSNAFYLIAGNGLGAVLGFVFWAVAARFYSTADVGLMSAAISAVVLLDSLSTLGLGTALIRFLPRDDQKAARLINFSLSLVFVTAAVSAVIFLLGTGVWSPGLSPFRRDAGRFLVFTLLAAFTAMTVIADGVFIARRRASFAMGRGLLMNGLKLLLVLAFAVTARAYGIFTAWGIAQIVALLLGLLFFLPRLVSGFRPVPNIEWRGKSEIVRYSLVNNVSSILAGLPGLLLPVVLLDHLGAEATAFFFIAWQIMSALASVPLSISTSLFAEGCHDEKDLVSNAWRGLRLALAILTPVVIALLLFSAPLLRILGAGYSGHSTRLLQVLSLSLFPGAVNQVYFAVLRVHKRLRVLTILNGVIAVVALAVAYLLMPGLGAMGACIGWVTAQVLVALLVLVRYLYVRFRRNTPG